jgi:hypothetical protein
MRDEYDPKRHPQQQQSERLQFLKTFHVQSPGIQSPSRRIVGLLALSSSPNSSARIVSERPNRPEAAAHGNRTFNRSRNAHCRWCKIISRFGSCVKSERSRKHDRELVE